MNLRARFGALLVVAAATLVLLGCGDDDSSVGTVATSAVATSSTTQREDACLAFAEHPQFGGQARVGGSLVTDSEVECILEFRADAAWLPTVGLGVGPGCPAEASIHLIFTPDETGQFSFDPEESAEVDNGSCL
jgi:hypothetical protein